MRRCIAMATILLFSCVHVCAANDEAVVGAGGSWRPLKGQHPSVRMVRERVRMDIYRKSYDVVATFVFKNDGPATEVAMGFPESGSSATLDPKVYRTRSGFTRFSTTVDGVPVQARRVVDANDVGAPYYEAHWVKKVRFAAGQTRTIAVRYSSPLGKSVEDRVSASYRFSGGNWKGKVGESLFEARCHVPGWTLADLSTKDLKRTANGWKLRRTDWDAEETVQVLLETR